MCTLDVNKRIGTMDVGSMYIGAADVKGGQEKMVDDIKGDEDKIMFTLLLILRILSFSLSPAL